MTTTIPNVPAPPTPITTINVPSLVTGDDFDAYERGWLARDAAQTARIAELEQSPAPTPATLFGITAATTGTTLSVPQSVAAHRQWTPGGLLPYDRVFSTTKPLQWSDAKLKPIQPGETWGLSFKDWDEALFRSQLDGIPAFVDQVVVIHKHEPEDDAKNSGNIATFVKNYLAVYAQMDAIRKSHPNGGKVKLAKAMMRYQEIDQPTPGALFADFHGGQDFIDAFGWDCYRPAWQASRIPDVETFLQPVVDCSKQIGIPWCLTEVAIEAIVGDTDGSAHASWVQAIIDFCRANGALWAAWWCSGTWALEGTPGQKLWSAAMAGNPA